MNAKGSSSNQMKCPPSTPLVPCTKGTSCSPLHWCPAPSKFPEEMEVLFRRGAALPWTSQLVSEDIENGQIVKIGISQSAVISHFVEHMCQLVFGKKYFYLPNDELAFILNLLLDKVLKVMKARCESSERFEKLTWSIFLKTVTSAPAGKAIDNNFFSPQKVLDALNARIKESQELLCEKVSLDLTKFQVFYFFRGKWQRIKGKNVTQSAFGLWVTRERISKLVRVKDFQVLVCPMRKNEIINM